jgi:hypothetical protein
MNSQLNTYSFASIGSRKRDLLFILLPTITNSHIILCGAAPHPHFFHSERPQNKDRRTRRHRLVDDRTRRSPLLSWDPLGAISSCHTVSINAAAPVLLFPGGEDSVTSTRHSIGGRAQNDRPDVHSNNARRYVTTPCIRGNSPRIRMRAATTSHHGREKRGRASIAAAERNRPSTPRSHGRHCTAREGTQGAVLRRH